MASENQVNFAVVLSALNEHDRVLGEDIEEEDDFEILDDLTATRDEVRRVFHELTMKGSL